MQKLIIFNFVCMNPCVYVCPGMCVYGDLLRAIENVNAKSLSLNRDWVLLCEYMH